MSELFLQPTVDLLHESRPRRGEAKTWHPVAPHDARGAVDRPQQVTHRWAKRLWIGSFRRQSLPVQQIILQQDGEVALLFQPLGEARIAPQYQRLLPPFPPWRVLVATDPLSKRPRRLRLGPLLRLDQTRSQEFPCRESTRRPVSPRRPCIPSMAGHLGEKLLVRTTITRGTMVGRPISSSLPAYFVVPRRGSVFRPVDTDPLHCIK